MVNPTSWSCLCLTQAKHSRKVEMHANDKCRIVEDNQDAYIVI